MPTEPDGKVAGLERWLDRTTSREASLSGDPATDCVPLAWDVFAEMHGRRSNPLAQNLTAGYGVAETLSEGTSAIDAAELVRTLGGQTPTTNDGDAVLNYLAGTPGAMALVVARPRRDRSHVFWLVADGRDGQVVPRWVDPQQPGLFGHDARTVTPDTKFWAQQLRSPDTRMLVLGPDGGSVDLTLQPRDLTVAGLLDAPTGARAAAGLSGQPNTERAESPTAGDFELQPLHGRPAGESSVPEQAIGTATPTAENNPERTLPQEANQLSTRPDDPRTESLGASSSTLQARPDDGSGTATSGSQPRPEQPSRPEDDGRDVGHDERDSGQDNGREGSRDGGPEDGLDGGREDGREGGQEDGQEDGRDGGRDEGRGGGRGDGRGGGRDGAEPIRPEFAGGPPRDDVTTTTETTERLRTQDRAFLLGDGNHLLAAVLYGDLDAAVSQVRWSPEALVELRNLRTWRERGLRTVSTSALTHAVGDLRRDLSARIDRLRPADLAALRRVDSPALRTAQFGDNATLRRALRNLLAADIAHDHSLAGPMLVGALLNRPVVVDDGAAATLLGRGATTDAPIRLFRRVQDGTGSAEFHAHIEAAAPPPVYQTVLPPQPVPAPVELSALNQPRAAVHFATGRYRTLAPGQGLETVAGTIADRIERLAAGRPIDGAAINVTVEGGGNTRRRWNAPFDMGRRRAATATRLIEPLVRAELLQRLGGRAPIIMFRQQTRGNMPAEGVTGDGVNRAVTIDLSIDGTWQDARAVANPAFNPTTARYPLENGDLDSIAFAAALPAHTLPDLERLIGRLREIGDENNVPRDAPVWDQLPGLLINNYRHLVGDGMMLFLGNVEVLVHLDPTDPRPEVAPALSGTPDPTSRTAQVKVTETIHGTFQVGAHSESRGSPTQFASGGVSLGASFGVSPVGLLAVRVGVAMRFMSNLISRSTGTVRDAEVGRVEDTRSPSRLFSAAASYDLQVRTRSEQTWDSIPTERVDAAERLTVTLPENYLSRGEPGLAGQIAAAAGSWQRTPADAGNRLPNIFYASGLTGTRLLADDIIRQMEAVRGQIPLGHPIRANVWHRVSNLDTHLDKAVNRSRGYQFTVLEDDRIIADVRIRSRRRGYGEAVSAPHDKGHLEEVRTAISGTVSGQTVSNDTSVEASTDFVLAEAPGLRASVRAPFVRFGWSNRDSNNSGRLGLWVLVSRYAGFTTAYKMDFDHQAVVHVRRRRNVLRRHRPGTSWKVRLRSNLQGAHRPPHDPRTVLGRAMVRVPTGDAVSHGIERPPPPGIVAPTVPPTAFTAKEPAAVPHHAREGRGIGKGIVEVDPQLVDHLVDQIERELDRHGYLVVDPNQPFESRSRWSRTRDSQVRNGALLRKLLSNAGLESNYDGIHQDGLPITLRKRHSGWFTFYRVRTARVTIKAGPPQDFDAYGMLGQAQDPTSNPRLTKDKQIVNLEMGLDSAGSSAGGGSRITAGVRSRFTPTERNTELQGAGLGVEFDRGVSGNQSVNHVSNMPRLMEYQGELTEFETTSDYQVTIDYGRTWSWRRMAMWARPSYVGPRLRSTALARVVPAFNSKATHDRGQGRTLPNVSQTPASVLEHAAVSYLDSTGLIPRGREAVGAMAHPGGSADEEVSTFLDHTQVLSHLPEILGGRYTTDALFEGQFWRDKYRTLSVGAELGASEFVGATNDPYVLGLIKLSLTQAGTSSSRSYGSGVTPLDVAAGGDPGSSHVVGLSGSTGHGMRWGRERGRAAKQTGGRELLELNFHRAYAFRAPIEYSLVTGKTKRAKLFPNSDYVPREERVEAEPMIYVLSEPDALEHYANGEVPIDTEQLLDVLTRWSSGELKLSHRLMARVLTQWNSAAPDRDVLAGLRADAARDLARSYAWSDLEVPPAVANDFRSAFGMPLERDPATAARRLVVPDYLRPGTGQISLGHTGVHTITLNEGRELSDVITDAVEAFEPGLLGKIHDDLPRMGDTELRRWWHRAAQVQPFVGRLQGGIDAIQSIFDGGRAKPLLEQMLDPEGVTLTFANPHAWVAQDMIEVKVTARLTSTPEYRDYVPESGLETYRHRYVEQQESSRGQFTRSTGLGLSGTVDDRPEPPPSLEQQRSDNEVKLGAGPGVRWADGVTRGRTNTEQFSYESTVYDWGNHYRADANVTISVEVRRVKMGGRAPTNFITSGLNRLGVRTGLQPRILEATSTDIDGSVTLKVPKSVAEATPISPPTGLRGTINPQQMPPDAFVDAVQLHGAHEATRDLLGALFVRPVKWNHWWETSWPNRRDYHTSPAMRALATRDMLAVNLIPALAPEGVSIAEGVFLPGRSSRRADIRLHGRLEEMVAVADLENTGTGRYVKYQQGTSFTTTHSTPYVTASGSAGGPTRLGVADENSPGESYGAHRTDGVTDNSRQAPRSHSDTIADSYRRENHVKQQGPAVLVRMRGRYWLEGNKHIEHKLRATSQGRRRISDEFTGDVYVVMFKADYEEMVTQQRRSELSRAMPRIGRQGSPLVDLTTALNQLPAAVTETAVPPGRTDIAMRNHLGAVAGGLRGVGSGDVLVAEVHAAEQERQLADVLDAWARQHLTPQEIAAVHEWHRREPDGQDLYSLMVEEVNAGRPRDHWLEPPLVARLHRDPLNTAQALARELRAPIELRLLGERNTINRRYGIDRDGWYVELMPAATSVRPVPAEQAVNLLPQALRDEAAQLGIGREELVNLYDGANLSDRVQALVEARRSETESPSSVPLTDAQKQALAARQLRVLDQTTGRDAWLESVITTARNQPNPSAVVRQVGEATVDDLRTTIARRRGLPDDAPLPSRTAIAATLGIGVETIDTDGVGSIADVDGRDSGSSVGPTRESRLTVVAVGEEGHYRPTAPAPVSAPPREPGPEPEPVREPQRESEQGPESEQEQEPQRESEPQRAAVVEQAPAPVPPAPRPLSLSLSSSTPPTPAGSPRIPTGESLVGRPTPQSPVSQRRDERAVDSPPEATTAQSTAETSQGRLSRTLGEQSELYRIRASLEQQLREHVDAHPRRDERLRVIEQHTSAPPAQSPTANSELIGVLRGLLTTYQQQDQPARPSVLRLGRSPDWWHEGERNRPGQFYSPNASQQNWLSANGRSVGWVAANGDCAFAAVLETLSAHRVSTAANLVADAAGLARPGLLADAPALRDFLALLIERARTRPHTHRELALSEMGVVSEPAPDQLDVAAFAAELRRHGSYGGEAGANFTNLLGQFLRWGRRLAQDGGGDLDVDFEVLTPNPLEVERLANPSMNVIVLVNEHYLPTRQRDTGQPSTATDELAGGVR
ncbi:hypothetical protein C1I95_22420 [Micromonospora craterilacus]|uniref:Tox-PL domain-containing protein n=1 Tax=Micromonospora craterilacus TaxID=1655439 RepID=A0A2W2ENY1_9ACTN|nr:hypothetical protein [Micromonospora craterilacus]PZG14118.1 hypothetical protein C1I95_22420 [Micromonospora craterilacus]